MVIDIPDIKERKRECKHSEKVLNQGHKNIEPYKFEKGKSGNPNGRPKLSDEYRAMIKAATVPALNTVISIMMNDNARDKDRIECAKIVLDRMYGKAPQAVDTVDGMTNGENVTLQDMHTIAAAFMNAVPQKEVVVVEQGNLAKEVVVEQAGSAKEAVEQAGSADNHDKVAVPAIDNRENVSGDAAAVEVIPDG